MVSVAEAGELILNNLFKPQTQLVELKHAVGRVLAESILADRDFPPFNRVAMDGIAIHYKDWQEGVRTFSIVGVQAAGEPQKEFTQKGGCIEVMTGAMLPIGTDAVIRYEDIELKDNKAFISATEVIEGQNIHRQGQDAKMNSTLLEPNLMLSAAEIALLASVGKSSVAVYKFPTIAIIASGDELVAIDESPLPFQIRRSNSYALEAALQKMGIPSIQFHFTDTKDVLKNEIQKIVENYDVLILSGGISKGKFDFIPEVLQDIGIKNIFQHVNQRPGKPFWFGVGNQTTVFALPGNPVSTYMCFYRYIKLWLLKSFGLEDIAEIAVLASDFIFQPKLTYFLQVNVKNENGKLMAYPDAGGGSGDFANLKNVSGFLELPADQFTFKKGEVFPYYSFR